MGDKMSADNFIEHMNTFFKGMQKDFTNMPEEFGGKLTSQAFANYVESNINGMQRVAEKLKDLDLVQHFAAIIRKRGDISQKSQKPKAPERFKLDPAALRLENAKHDKDFKAMCQGFVDKIGGDGGDIPEAFKPYMKEKEGFGLARKGYKQAPVKGIARIIQKFFYKYGSDATKIVDIIRCSFVFDCIKELYCGLDMAIDHFVECNRQKNPKLTIKDCVWLKDRFKNPLKNGYRDIILQVRVPGTDIWAETQFHLKDCIRYKNEHQHKMYEILRHFPNDGAIQKTIVANMAVAKARKIREQRENIDRGVGVKASSMPENRAKNNWAKVKNLVDKEVRTRRLTVKLHQT